MCTRAKALFKNILAAENSLAKVKFIANKGVDKGCILCHRIIYNALGGVVWVIFYALTIATIWKGVG